MKKKLHPTALGKIHIGSKYYFGEKIRLMQIYLTCLLHMNLKFQLSIALMISMLSLLVFSFLAFVISVKKIVQFDNTVISFVQGFENPGLTTIMKLFSIIGDTPAVIVLSLVVLLFLYFV